jgi:hypothetical protein
MKSSYKSVRESEACDCEEILATYPPGLDFLFNKGTGEASAGGKDLFGMVRWFVSW